MHEWQASQAGSAFADIIDAAAEGDPQLIRRRDGKDVVIVSRAWFDAHRPNLRDYLLTAGYAEAHDAFDDAMDRVRGSGTAFFVPRPVTFDE